MTNPPFLSVTPEVHYPLEVEVGKTYEITINLVSNPEFDWGNRGEDYPIHLAISSENHKLILEFVDKPTIIMHRFGGSYGAAKCLLKVSSEIEENTPNLGSKENSHKAPPIRNTSLQHWNAFDAHNTYHFTTTDRDYIEIELIDAWGNTLQSYKTTEIGIGSKQKVPLRVFISYSHDSEEHLERVLKLSDYLREGGIDANINHYELSPSQGWMDWTKEQIESANVVLMVLTNRYKRIFLETGMSNKNSRLVYWTDTIITKKQYDQISKKVVVATYDEDLELPSILANTPRYNISNSYEKIYEHLTGGVRWKKLNDTSFAIP
jgi:hypothetical protein